MHDVTELNTGFLTRPQSYTQPVILQRMLVALANMLPSLKTRDDNDPIIALLDSWAMALDVLSFYQQQFNNESYLKTATELLSARQLAREINYELNPGVAANTHLAFQVDTRANNTGIAVIPKGTQVQSIPSRGALPQTFETSQDLTAYATWNQLKPYQPQVTNTQTIYGNSTSVWLAGIATGLTEGDVLLLTGTLNTGVAATDVAYQLTVQAVSVDAPNNRTKVTWQTDWASASDQDLSGNSKVLIATDTVTNPQLWVFAHRVASFGNNAPLVSSFPASSYYMDKDKGGNDWDGKNQVTGGTNNIPTIWQDSQASFFGPEDKSTPPKNTFSPQIYLNQSLPAVTPDSFILLSANGKQKLYQVDSTQEVSRADFGISGQVTTLTLNGMDGKAATDDSNFLFRSTAIYAQSEPLTLYTTVTDDETFILHDASQGIPLTDGVSLNLQIGQSLIISNILESVSETIVRDDESPTNTPLVSTTNQYTFTLEENPKFSYQPGTTTITGDGIAEPIAVILNASNPKQFIINATVNPIPATTKTLRLAGTLVQQSEVFTLNNSQEIEGHTVLYPQKSLTNSYSPATSIIYANVVASTHGASVTEVLGSGDATQTNQQFTLQKSPLTYASSSSSSDVSIIPGSQSTLTIQVNGVTWKEAPGLYGLTPNDKSYVVTQEDDGKVKITFGDGIQGARLPTGQENIVATYRQGIGAAGNVASSSLILLQARPQGVTGVTNPAAASGGVDPETLTAAYQNAPSGVLTMNRLVSQSDFGNYVSTYTGISKSRTDLLQQNGQPLLYITIAGENGVIPAGDPIYTNLLNDINRISNPGQNVQVGSYKPMQFNLEATLTLDPAYEASQVKEQVMQALLTTYGFEQQRFAQSVTAGDIIETIRKVPGVLAVDLNALYFDGDARLLNSVLTASQASITNNIISQAQLLTINPSMITLD